MGCPLCRLLFGFNFAETPFLGGNRVFILLKPLLSDGLNVVSGCVGKSLSVDVKPFYSELTKTSTALARLAVLFVLSAARRLVLI